MFYANPPTPTLSIDDVPLNFVNCAKILGIWLQDDLKWDKQIKEMLMHVKKANSRLYMLRNLKRFGLIPLSLVIFTKAMLDPC